MALPTVALNEATPAGSSYVRDGDDRIREYKIQVREILEIDHYFPSSGQNDSCGRHKQLTLIEVANVTLWTTAIPVLGAVTVAGKPELVYKDEDDTNVILTDVGKIALQNGRLPNNTYLIARNAAGAANVNMFKVNASDIIEFASFPITPSAAPDADYEVANKKYTDDQITANSGKDIIQVQQADGTTDITTSSSTFVDMTDMSLSVVVATGDTVIIDFSANAKAGGGNVAFQLLRDSTVLQKVSVQHESANYMRYHGLQYVDTPAAATYTYKIQWLNADGTASYNNPATENHHRNLRATKILAISII